VINIPILSSPNNDTKSVLQEKIKLYIGQFEQELSEVVKTKKKIQDQIDQITFLQTKFNMPLTESLQDLKKYFVEEINVDTQNKDKLDLNYKRIKKLKSEYKNYDENRLKFTIPFIYELLECLKGSMGMRKMNIIAAQTELVSRMGKDHEVAQMQDTKFSYDLTIRTLDAMKDVSRHLYQQFEGRKKELGKSYKELQREMANNEKNLQNFDIHRARINSQKKSN
jgi:hypothetical protein